MIIGWKAKSLLLGIFTCSGAALTLGCAVETQEEGISTLGTLKLPLTATTEEFTYRLVNAQLSVAGPENQNFSLSPNDELFTASLPVGEYLVTLQQGYQLQRTDGSGATITVNDVVLTSENPVSAEIDAQATTRLRFDFDVSGRGIAFGEGGLEVEISVCDDPEGCAEDPEDPTQAPLLASTSALFDLCPSGTVGLGGVQIFAEMSGSAQGELDGPSMGPVAGSWPVLGTCNSISRPVVDGSVGTLTPSPWYLFMPPSEALVFLSQAWANAETMSEMVFHYFEESESGGQSIETHEVDLEDARIWGVERLLLPDPQGQGGVLDVVRVQVGYREMTWTSPQAAVEVVLDGPQDSVPFETPACSGSTEGEYRYFLEIDSDSLGTISGASQVPGEEDTIEVFGFCHSSLPAGGSLAMGPITVVKQSDESTALLLSLLDSFSSSELNLNGYRANPSSGELEQVFSYELEDARLLSMEQSLSADTLFESLEFDFRSFTLTWLEDNPRQYEYQAEGSF